MTNYCRRKLPCNWGGCNCKRKLLQKKTTTGKENYNYLQLQKQLLKSRAAGDCSCRRNCGIATVTARRKLQQERCRKIVTADSSVSLESWDFLEISPE